ncbi:M48 family metallopeptidase [Sneathiella marina]|uniref:M48 family metallopeptidase n=1 Tax=Sneathiella marina TaxID=2950108 RepID=A0ABY4W2F8_9PROT|nr:SprT family zinc-dependent metalloprotease [Sneathiella marina]USG61365.1 M48 family metallopeptidase [Sneathiella marina]
MFNFRSTSGSKFFPEYIDGPHPYLQLEQRQVPVEIKRSPRASRLKLRIDRHAGVVLILPPRASIREGLSFLKRELHWVIKKIEKVPEKIPFLPGSIIPLLGTPHTIIHAPQERGLVWPEDRKIFVTGHIEHVPRRIRDWIKKAAKSEIAPRALDYTKQLDVTHTGITLRDQKTRWGSCSSTGRLNFSWRLFLMPEFVLDYVVAHEVAHLRHMNHSAQFWGVVNDLSSDVKSAKKWLIQHGSDVHRYGP